MYNEYEIRQLPLSLKSCRQKVETFLAQNGLREARVDYYAGIFERGQDDILGGGGLDGDVIKCLAVGEQLRNTGMGLELVSHLISMAASRGTTSVKLFTKPENRHTLEDMGFNVIARAPKAILMENGNALHTYCSYLRHQRTEGTAGVIVMNANPFTRGHRYLVEQAAQQVQHLYVIVVREDVSVFPYAERKAMITAGCKDLRNVTVCEGSSYTVSAATFPTYFLKQLTDATETHIALDLDLFVHHIAPALRATVRFVGSEPTDHLTRAYNEAMHRMLPQNGIKVVELKRKEQDGKPISASDVRRLLREGNFQEAIRWVYSPSVPYILGEEAALALQAELDTTPKPGLVDKHDNGAHTDMNYHLMEESIKALRPYLAELATIGYQTCFPSTLDIRKMGMEAEEVMFSRTHGINTHKGALFSMGFSVIIAAHLFFHEGKATEAGMRLGLRAVTAQWPAAKGTHGQEVTAREGVKGALQNAREGYPQLFNDWLPFMRRYRNDPYCMHKTLLRIMATIDDTNIYHRKGPLMARQVKQEALEALQTFSIGHLEEMNRSFTKRNISPGGAADMLALTRFMMAITEAPPLPSPVGRES